MRFVVVIQNRYKELIGCYGPFDTDLEARKWLNLVQPVDGRVGTVMMVHYAKSKRG